jgi:hypothetical protein
MRRPDRFSRYASFKGRVEVVGSMHVPSPHAMGAFGHQTHPLSPERLQKDRHHRHHRHTLKISLVL